MGRYLDQLKQLERNNCEISQNTYILERTREVFSGQIPDLTSLQNPQNSDSRARASNSIVGTVENETDEEATLRSIRLLKVAHGAAHVSPLIQREEALLEKRFPALARSMDEREQHVFAVHQACLRMGIDPDAPLPK